MIFDNSALQKFNECPKAFYWSGLRHLGPKLHPTPLGRGSAFHKGVAEWYRTGSIAAAQQRALTDLKENYPNEPELVDDLYVLVTVCLNGYAEKYPEEEYMTIGTEMPMAHFIEPYWYVGECDQLIKQEVLMVKETKTVSSMPWNWESKYFMDSQTIGYMKLARWNGYDVRGVIVDLVRVPDGKRTKYPDYQRIPFFPQEHILQQWEEETVWKMKDISARIKELNMTGRHTSFPKTTQACFNWNRECEFLNLCLGSAGEADLISFLKQGNDSRLQGILKEALAQKQARERR